MSQLRIAVLLAADESFATLSYLHGWPRGLAADPRLRCTFINTLAPDRKLRNRWVISQCDAVVILHSVFSQGNLLRGDLALLIAGTRKPKVWFIGNEYKLMPEKMEFAENVGVNVLVSQILSEPALGLYRERLRCEVLALSNTGLDRDLFCPGPPLRERPIDVGYRAFDTPWYVGHRERVLLAEVFDDVGPRHGLLVDASYDPGDRFDEPSWAAFLQRCKTQLGCEAGTDFFELDDHTRIAVNAFIDEHPHATYDEVFARFFTNYTRPVSGRTISGRVVEAAGTMTPQVLLEGSYGGLFRPGEHYISLRKDLANLDSVLAQVADLDHCERLAAAAHEVAVTRLTYPALVTPLIEAIERAS
ncbi:MAG: hypothetical protein F2663_09585 [Actinobacteria bacterium]|uniref:Unannotated protein n=1 Tax=freshwater metagenome TaxID=449393 RepID=A0A6J6QHL8_9ZZZZ|nr:hypothetical protein [Actinomycetota bacterium]